MAKKAPLYLVDSSIYIFRAYFSMPDSFFDPQGRSINAAYGFTHFLLDLIGRIDNPQALVGLAFDESLETGFRHELYPEYKANRALPDEELAYQLDLCRELAEGMGFYCVASEEYEADDLIAALHRKFTAGKRYQDKVSHAVVVTRDKDLAQLIREEDLLWDFAKDEQYSYQRLQSDWGFDPALVPDFLAIAGDSVDNIPGVPGVGKKTATELLAQIGGIDAIYADLAEVGEQKNIRGAKKLMQKLEDHQAEVELYLQLTRLASDAGLTGGIKALSLENVDYPWLQQRLQSLGIERGFLKKIARLQGE